MAGTLASRLNRLLPLREKVPEGRMRGLSQPSPPLVVSLRSRSLRLRTPHPALRATFSRKGRRSGVPNSNCRES
jgi:hypothetical protein